MSVKQWFGVFAVVVFFVVGLAWALQGTDFFLYKIFAPKYEQVRRETFEQSKAYRQGMIQELQNMQFQYEQADPAHKQALASLILHRAADFEVSCPDAMPADLKAFVQKLKDERTPKPKPEWEK